MTWTGVRTIMVLELRQRVRSTRWRVMLIVWGVVLVLLAGVLIALLMPLFRSMQDKLDNVNGVLREQITGIRVVRAFGRKEYETQRFTASADTLRTVMREFWPEA